MLELTDLTMRFGGVTAISSFSLTVGESEIVAIIGPNGAGKTTVFNMISRFYQPSSGSLRFHGRSLTRLGPHDIAAIGIARTFQNIELFASATVLDNLLIGRHGRDNTPLWWNLLYPPALRKTEAAHRRRVEDVIDLLGLQRYRNELTGTLPYGVRKVVELGRALCAEPKLLLLDEPAAGLNPEETDDMRFWIEDVRDELGISVLMIEHDMKLVASVSDRVIALNYGVTLTEGDPASVLAHPGVVEAYLGATHG